MKETKQKDEPDKKPAAKPDGLRARFKSAYRKFLRIHGEPREIALGLALGLFVGMSPSMGFQTLIAVPIAALFGWNKLSAAMGVWISNPLTAPVLYGLTYLVGAELMELVTGTSPLDRIHFSSVLEMLESTPDLIVPLVIGGVVLGIPIAIAGYYISIAAVKKYRDSIKPSLSNKVKKIRQQRRSRPKGKKKKKRR